MSFIDDLIGYGKDTYKDIDRNFGGYLPGGVDSDDPYRTGGQYEGVDRANFDLPGYQQQQDRYGNYLSQVDGRQAPTVNPYERGQQSAFAGDQRALASMLMDRARGNNSVAELQLKQGADMANKQQMSMMAGARPHNAALAMMMGSQNMAGNMMGLSGATALARAQEAQQASQSLGQLLAQGRGADEALSTWNAGQQNQRHSQNAQMQQQQYAIDDAARGNLLGGSLDAARAQQQGGAQYEQNRTQRYGAAMAAPTTGEVFMGGLQGLGKSLMGGG